MVFKKGSHATNRIRNKYIGPKNCFLSLLIVKLKRATIKEQEKVETIDEEKRRHFVCVMDFH